RFPIGDPGASAPDPTPGGPPVPVVIGPGSGPGGVGPTFSGDSKWVVFSVYPTTKEAKRLKQTRRPIQTKAVLVELATGKKTEFEKTRRSAFSGERSPAIALQRYGPEAPQGPPAAAAAANPGGPATPAADRPSGSDLLLYELATGSELSLGNVSEF